MSNPGQYWFLRYGDECYALTRFCYFAFMQSTVFRMAHHTIEYYLKAALLESLDVGKLRKLNHNLSGLADEFELHRFDMRHFRQIIDYINLFERTRYPHIESFSHVLWGSSFSEFFERFPEPHLQERVACFHLGDFDRLAHLIRSATASSEDPLWAGPSELSREYLFKDNHCFLPTTRE